MTRKITQDPAMPKVNRALWRRCREELDLTSDQAAIRLKITGGYLRNVEGGTDEPSDRLIHRAARLYGRTYEDLLAGDPEDPETEPPDQAPQGPTAPPRRRNGDDKAGKGPKRVAQAEARAS